jgi:hypothetical protein
LIFVLVAFKSPGGRQSQSARPGNSVAREEHRLRGDRSTQISIDEDFVLREAEGVPISFSDGLPPATILSVVLRKLHRVVPRISRLDPRYGCQPAGDPL